MNRSIRNIALALLAGVCAFASALAAAEYVKNGDFENGEVAPWSLTKPNDKVSVAVIPDGAPPSGGSGVLAITPSGAARIDLRQNVKIGPGKYKLSAWMDTTRCTERGGHVAITLDGRLNGKWHRFGGLVSASVFTDKSWRKIEWTKYEAEVTVPPGGEIRSIYITVARIKGTAMVDAISLQGEGSPAPKPEPKPQATKPKPQATKPKPEPKPEPKAGKTAAAAVTGSKEHLNGGFFDNGSSAEWRISGPKGSLSLAAVDGDAVPSGSRFALAATSPQPVKTGFSHSIHRKIDPGTYMIAGQIDAARCADAKGYLLIQLTGTLNKKWHLFAGRTIKIADARKGWTKWEAGPFTVPENGQVKTLSIKVINVTGTVLVDRFSIREVLAEPRLEMTARRHRSLFRVNETPELDLQLANPLEKPIEMELSLRTTDYFGKTVAESAKTVTIPAKRKLCEVLRYPECKLPGYYCTTAEWRAGSVKGKTQASFVKVGPVPAKRDPLFAQSFYSEMDFTVLDLLAVGAKGVQFHWRQLNYAPTYFDEVEKQLTELKKLGIEPIGEFCSHYGTMANWSYWKTWMPKGKVPEGKEPTIQDLKDVLIPFVRKIVTRFKPYIHDWYLGGEIEGGYQKHARAVEIYVEMTKFNSAAIKAADPAAIVSGPGCGGGRVSPRFPWLKKLLPEIKDSLDGLSLDTYTHGQQYGKGYITLNSEEADLRNMMLEALELAKATRLKFVDIAEKGPFIVRSTPFDDPCGATMANMAARDYIILKTLPQIRHWLYYKTTNSHSIADQPNGWGMWEGDNPRQVVSAYAATARIMGNAEFVRELPIHRDIPCWIFKKDGRYFAAIWYNGKDPLKAKLADGIPAEAKDVQGNPVSLEKRVVCLGEAPLYLYADSPEALEKLLKHAADNVSELSFRLERLFAGKTVLIVRNQSGKGIRLKLAQVETSGPTGKKVVPLRDEFTLAPGEVKSIEKPVGGESVAFTLETAAGRRYTAAATLKSVPVPRVSGFAELEKKGVPQLLNDPTKQINCYEDLKVHGNYTGLDDLSAVFRLGYDDKFLYLAVTVKDDIHLNDNPPASIWNGDGLQYAIDPNRDAGMLLMRGSRGYANDDFNFASALVNGIPRTRCYVASAKTREKMMNRDYRLAPEILRDEAAKTTTYRIKLAFDDLVPLKPIPGKVFGFSLIVMDRDTPTSLYHMDCSQGVSHPFDPSQYPAFRFE